MQIHFRLSSLALRAIARKSPASELAFSASGLRPEFQLPAPWREAPSPEPRECFSSRLSSGFARRQRKKHSLCALFHLVLAMIRFGEDHRKR